MKWERTDRQRLDLLRDGDRPVSCEFNLVLARCARVLEQDSINQRTQHRQGIDVESNNTGCAIAHRLERGAFEGKIDFSCGSRSGRAARY